MKRYTAQEMRELADRMFDYRYDTSGFEIVDCQEGRVDCDGTCDMIAMLRQAADDLEREEKREKKYEYGVDYTNKTNGDVCSNHHHFDSLKQAKRYATPLPDEEVRFVRREVGEWKEVDDEEG